MGIIPIGNKLPKVEGIGVSGPRICSTEELADWKEQTAAHTGFWFSLRDYNLGIDQSEASFKREYRKAQAQTRALKAWLNDVKVRDLSKFESDSMSYETAGRLSTYVEDGVTTYRYTIYARHMENRTAKRKASA